MSFASGVYHGSGVRFSTAPLPVPIPAAQTVAQPIAQGPHYCGRLVSKYYNGCTSCDGYCGLDGCNCVSCHQKDVMSGRPYAHCAYSDVELLRNARDRSSPLVYKTCLVAITLKDKNGTTSKITMPLLRSIKKEDIAYGNIIKEDAFVPYRMAVGEAHEIICATVIQDIVLE